ncbi:unnamed protein product [Ranitomeya imitator]|uniref:Uncharacterized protein n=1 Tax=Ranitomeya imitator TaxID=111125 RepID=A0ABN9KSK2_9NEOB|nr:unnamed protein product [Ranitomeya imitator]
MVRGGGCGRGIYLSGHGTLHEELFAEAIWQNKEIRGITASVRNDVSSSAHSTWMTSPSSAPTVAQSTPLSRCFLESGFGKEGAALMSWQECLVKVKQCIGLWNLRRLTCEGKVLVLRNEILPVLQYTAQAWPPM